MFLQVHPVYVWNIWLPTLDDQQWRSPYFDFYSKHFVW
jgi:hypothetical protein